MSASVLSSHRQTQPYGVAGGKSGETGKNTIKRSQGETQLLDATEHVEMEAGDVFVIEPPGGGGYGVIS